MVNKLKSIFLAHRLPICIMWALQQASCSRHVSYMKEESSGVMPKKHVPLDVVWEVVRCLDRPSKVTTVREVNKTFSQAGAEELRMRFTREDPYIISLNNWHEDDEYESAFHISKQTLLTRLEGFQKLPIACFHLNTFGERVENHELALICAHLGERIFSLWVGERTSMPNLNSFPAMAQSLKNLQRLRIYNDYAFTDSTAIAMADNADNLTNLQDLALERTRLTDTGMVALTKKLTKLKNLTIGEAAEFTDRTIIAIADNLENLENLELYDFRVPRERISLTANGLDYLLSKRPTLKKIEIGGSGFGKITKKEIDALKEKYSSSGVRIKSPYGEMFWR